MDAIHAYSRYGAVVGVYHEWHALIFRLAQMLAPSGEPQGLAYITEFGKQLIADRAQQGKRPNPGRDFISLMYDMHLKDPSTFSIDDILFHSVPNIGAGSDTTAITLSAVLYHLCRNPNVLEKLRAELEDKMRNRHSDQLISFREAQECTYLQAVIKETMRVHPGNGLPMPRVVPKGGLVLAGHYFPEGVSFSPFF